MDKALRYKIDEQVFLENPGYRRGIVVLRSAKNSGSHPTLEKLLRAEEGRLRENINGHITDHPVIAEWREAYRRFGAKPSEHRCSIEAISRRVLKSDLLPTINPLVDIGNIISLRYFLPAGAHPLPKSYEPLELRSSMAEDVFRPLDGGALETPAPREIVFAQGNCVLTRRWTWRQAAGTQTSRDTTDVLFNIDGLPPTGESTVLDAMCDIEKLAVEFTGAEVIFSTLLTADRPQALIFI